ncbi:MAG: hypothetical protein ACYSX0_19600, partial [Planctomycetota bacterium]
AGTTIGVRGRALGLVDTGLMVGVKPNATSLGWRYGKVLTFAGKDGRYDADHAEIIRTNSILDFDYEKGSYKSARKSVALFPALFTWTDSTPTGFEWEVPEEGEDFREKHWIWSKETGRNNRYAQIHAFDVEVEIGLLVYAEAGFSFGETLDFLLGIFTIDIAKDDGRIGGDK